ncbi:MAG: hypothetical protein IKE57_01805 [Oscillospiraceae bacterium]|nr:hypothetical protein [Oscillospiraceae bacterium]
MQNADELLVKRFRELAERSYSRGIWTYSDFLDLAGQSDLMSAGLRTPCVLLGGFEGAERAVACFGSEELCGCAPSPPVRCVRVTPVSERFADPLTHRDFLGSLMALGIKRETLGDILLEGSTGYILCLDRMAEYIRDTLTQVRHTTVTCALCIGPPEDAFPRPERRSLNVASLRCDAVTAAVYRLSRGESQELFRQKKVFVNSRLCADPSRELKEGDRVSVRGRGRYVFTGAAGETRKGRLRIETDVYA